MSSRKPSQSSQNNKKNPSKNGKQNEAKKPPKAALARIKAQVDARKKAIEEAERMAKEELEKEERRLEEEIAKEELEKEEKRLEKARKTREREISRKKQEEKDKERILKEKLSRYGYSMESSSDVKPSVSFKSSLDYKSPVIKSKPESDSSDPGWDDLDKFKINPDLSSSVTEISVPENSEPPVEYLRSPIVCVLGHVDVGKTKLLDYLRQTHVQDNEAGGITQQIGSSFFPINKIIDTISRVNTKKKIDFNIPGLLVIDTPGHESFVNLRSRGTGICDFAILVVDLLAGLERQTIESIKLLKMRKTPFVIALNKLDLVYEWKSEEGGSSAKNFRKQSKDVQQTFSGLADRILVEMAEQGLNARLYWQNRDPKGTISMVPTSARTGEGIPDLLLMITQMVQRYLSKKVTYNEDFEATVLEVKPIQGLGTTVDIILINGTIKRGDSIVLSGFNGPLVTTVKSLLTTQPMKELRIKSPYIRHESVTAAQGVKIIAHDLEQVIAGSSVYLGNTEDACKNAYKTITKEYENIKSNIELKGEGVYVQASTLGGLEALLHFLSESNVPVMGFNIGPVTKSDVIKTSIMYSRGLSEYSVILAFDVKISEDVRIDADKSHVRIFEADIIYHLLDMFRGYLRQIEESKREAASHDAITPCILEILPQYIFNVKNPIIIGVLVKEGELRIGTPLCVLGKKPKETLEIGRVTKIELNHRERDIGRLGEEVAISIDGPDNYCYGRQFDHTQKLYSSLSRRSIDALKKFFIDTLTPDRVRLIMKIKKKLGIE